MPAKGSSKAGMKPRVRDGKKTESYRVRYRGPDRKERSKTFTDATEAAVFKSETQVKLARGQWIDPTGAKTLFGDYGRRWMKSTTNLKPKTIASYESLFRTKLLPAFEHAPLGSIAAMDVREWMSSLQERGFSASHRRQCYHLLGAIFKTAIVDGLVADNPCRGIKLPPLPVTEMHYLNPEQLRGLLDAIDPRYKMFIAVLGIGGLRFGEATALRVGRCDLLRSRLMVVESLADVNGHFHFGDPKTHQKRAVTIPKFLRDELGAHIAGAESPSDLVFTAPEGGPIRYSGFYKRFWKPALEKADLPHMGLHALRHTCAALLIAEGAHPKAIQLHLGHQSITTTLDTYGHLFESEHEKLAERIDTAYAGVLGSSQPLQRPDEVTRTVQRLGELETRVPGLVVGGVGLR